MSIIKRVTHQASLSFVNLILALGSVPTVALSSSTSKSRIMIPVGICSCQCTISPERVINLGGITDQFARNKWSTSPVSLSTKNGIFNPILLIIDEWLLMKPTEAQQQDIMELLHRRRRRSSTIFCSQYSSDGWYDQLGGDDSPLAEPILDRIKHNAYRINIVPSDPTNYRSMREVYGLDQAIAE